LRGHFWCKACERAAAQDGAAAERHNNLSGGRMRCTVCQAYKMTVEFSESHRRRIVLEARTCSACAEVVRLLGVEAAARTDDPWRGGGPETCPLCASRLREGGRHACRV
jgi:hypothetical protein